MLAEEESEVAAGAAVRVAGRAEVAALPAEVVAPAAHVADRPEHRPAVAA